MKVINKHPEYKDESERSKKLNQIYTFIIRTINKIDIDQEYPVVHKQNKNT